MSNLTLSEFEARCLGHSTGPVTPEDAFKAVARINALVEQYADRKHREATQWRAPRAQRVPVCKTWSAGMDKSLPKGDQ